MKRVCFFVFEGIFCDYLDYVVDVVSAESFLKNLFEFGKTNNVDFFLITGFNEKIALKKFEESFVSKYFDKKNFVFVDSNYINSKHETDKEIYLNNFEKDYFFVDSFFKQVIIPKIISEKNLSQTDVVLFCNDVWVDGYYTLKFSKIDFVIFKNNVLDRGKKIDLIDGLVYFDFGLNFENIFSDFPLVNNSFLEKYVFEEMKKVLLKDVDLSVLKNKLKNRE